MGTDLQQREKHPQGFKFIFWGELTERASFYGVVCLITTYLTSTFHFTEGKAGVVAHGFKALSYILPVLGGYIADRWLGKFRTVIYFSVPYIIGHIVLGGFTKEGFMYLGLLLLAAGTGVVKPNISPLMGLMYKAEGKSEALLQDAFSYFYMSINIGATASMVALPWIRDKYGYGTAFMIPAALMVAAMILFYLGKPHYPVETPGANKSSPEEQCAARGVLKGMLGIFAFFPVFFLAYDQQNTTWVFFAKEMKLYGFAPDAIQWLNPALIMIFSPLFSFIWRKLDDKGVKMRSTDKMFVGFILAALCMATLSIAGLVGSPTDKASLWWEVAAYVILGAAEMCICVVGLKFAFSEAPKSMESQVTAVYLLTIFVGNLIAGVVTTWYTRLGPTHYFGLLALALLVNATVFRVVAKRYNATTAGALAK